MKTSLIAASLALVALFVSPSSAHKATISFTICNQQSESLGQVTVSAPEGDTYLDVPGLSNVSVDIPSTATSVTINGQVVEQGVKTDVTLPSSKIVTVVWESTGIIGVLDNEILGMTGTKCGISNRNSNERSIHDRSFEEREFFNSY